jgi:ABC-type branched-subunit amino acid transport system substrate-binding protein
VTDSEIILGNINTISGPVPGLGASQAAAVRAYVDYRNSIGGACGRQIRLLQADDGLDVGRNRAIYAEYEPQVLAMVGGNANGNAGGAQVVNETGIPVVGTGNAPEMDAAATFYPVNPLNQRDVATPKYRWLYEQGVRRAAVVYVSAAVSAAEGQRQAGLMRASGIEVVNEQSLPLSTLSFDSPARAVANSGADYLFFVHADGSSATMAQAMDDTGYDGLLFEEYIVAYGSNFIDLAGEAAEGASSWIFALPAEDGGTVPEQAAFLQWMAQTAPDASVDTFASLGWAAARTLLDTIEALPGPISRDALLAQLDATGTVDAGGLVAPFDLGGKAASGCQIGMIVEAGQWRRMNPSSGFYC